MLPLKHSVFEVARIMLI